MPEMTKTKRLEITPADILDYISLTGTWIQCADSEADGYINPQKLLTIAQESESRVFSALPEKYRCVCSGHINGLILCQWSDGGETEFVLPDGLINNVKSLKIYKNFPFELAGFKPQEKQPLIYELRTPDNSYTDYEFTNLTGTIVLAEPLEPGDSLVCDVNYLSSAWILELVEVTKKLAASNIIPALPQVMSYESITLRQSNFYTDAYAYLNRLTPEPGKNPCGISSIDDLKIVKTEKIRKTFSGVAQKFFWNI